MPLEKPGFSNSEDIFEKAKAYGEKVEQAIPHIESAASIKELWDAVDSVKGWSEKIEVTKGTKDQLEDPRKDVERMKAWLKNVALGSTIVANNPYADINDKLAKAIKRAGEGLGLFD